MPSPCPRSARVAQVPPGRSTSPSSRPPCTTRYRPSKDASNRTTSKCRGAAGSRAGRRGRGRYYVLVGITRRRPGPRRRPTTTTSTAMAWWATPASRWASRSRPAILPLRREPAHALPGDTAPGRWRPTDSLLHRVRPDVGRRGRRSGRRTLRGGRPFRGWPPPAVHAQELRQVPRRAPARVKSTRYQREYDEVRTLGARLDTATRGEAHGGADRPRLFLCRQPPVPHLPGPPGHRRRAPPPHR